MSDVVVSSAELQKAFGRYREAALREPVVITNHGRESLVLMSAVEYRRLKRQDRAALHPGERGGEDLKAIAEARPAPEAGAFDDEFPARALPIRGGTS